MLLAATPLCMLTALVFHLAFERPTLRGSTSIINHLT
jgi:hypothetical protein